MVDPLKSCNACGHQISRYSPFCRNCGHPQGSPLLVWLLTIFLLVAVAAYVGMMVFCMHNVEKFRVYGPPERGELQKPGPEPGEPGPRPPGE